MKENGIVGKAGTQSRNCDGERENDTTLDVKVSVGASN
jgi:hypothetical protein